jgi:hypothetical protein
VVAVFFVWTNAATLNELPRDDGNKMELFSSDGIMHCAMVGKKGRLTIEEEAEDEEWIFSNSVFGWSPAAC